MAEIPIQEKHGNRSWMWIAALLLVALLAWMFLANDEDDVDVLPAVETGASTPTVAPAAQPSLHVAA